MKILFVCLGNICRSPTAEGVMRRLVVDAGLHDRIAIDSAGTGSWHVGESPDPRTREAATRRGLALDHRARQVTRADLDDFDLIVAMDRSNLAHLTRLAAATEHGGKLSLLRRFDPIAAAHAEVPDPYSGGARGFDDVLDICERACAGLLAHVMHLL
jgi:protein-tyrosine phosphatase